MTASRSREAMMCAVADGTTYGSETHDAADRPRLDVRPIRRPFAQTAVTKPSRASRRPPEYPAKSLILKGGAEGGIARGGY